jgi:hypothetical protein
MGFSVLVHFEAKLMVGLLGVSTFGWDFKDDFLGVS